MDSLDVRILRLLLQGQALSPLNPDFRESFAAIARTVRADEDTVRHRVKKLHETGFLEGWRLFVNPRLWGGGQVVVLFAVDPSSSNEEVVEKLRLVPGVIIISSYTGRLGVIVDYDDERSLPRQVELIRRLSAAPDVLVARLPLPECRVALSERDRDLIRALQKNPRKSCSALARELGVSSRTVKTKLSRLMREGVAFAWPSLNPRGVQGSVLAWLLVSYPSERKGEIDETIMRHLDRYLWHVTHMLPYRSGDLQPCGFNLAVPNVLMAREIQSWAKDIPGVETARVDLDEDVFTFFDSYDEDLDKKLRQMPTAMPGITVGSSRKRPLPLRQS